MGYYLKSEKTGRFHYNPTIKRSTLLRDYQRTKPIRPEIAGVRHRTWERKAEPKPPIDPPIYEYTVYSSETGPLRRRITFEARTTMTVEGDPYSQANLDRATRKIRRGYDRLYMSQINDILDDPQVTGVRLVSEHMEGVEVGTIKRGMMYRSVEGRAVEKLTAGLWRQTRWVKEGGRWLMRLR